MMRQLALPLAVAAAAASPSASAIELTPDNYAAETEGKTVFLKFFAPWCGHCKALAPDWDKLTESFAGSATQLVAKVDCDGDGEELCQEWNIEGFPTLKWGDPMDLTDYDGGRSYEDLKAFADANLKPLCSVKNVELCDDEKKEQIQRYQAMSTEDLYLEIERESQKVNEANDAFEEEVQKLQDRFEELSAEKDARIAAVKAGGLGLMRSVLAAKDASDGKDEL